MSVPPSDVFSIAGNPYQLNTIPSSFDIKSEILKLKLLEKNNKLAPPPTVTSLAGILAGYTDTPTGSNRFGDLGDLAESSHIKDFGNIGNLLSGNINPNRRVEADAAAGLNPDVRTQLSSDIQQNIDTFAQGIVDFKDGEYGSSLANFGRAAYDTAAIAPELLADSAASLTEGVVGAAATAAPTGVSNVAGVGILGRRAKKIAEGYKGIRKSIAEAEERITSGKKVTALDKAVVGVSKTSKATVGDRAVIALAKTAKAASQTSMMTANLLQEYKESYFEEHKRLPSVIEWAVNTPIMIASNTLQLGIWKKFFLPTPGKDLKKLGESVLDTAKRVAPSKKLLKADRKALKAYADYVKSVIDPIPKGYVRKVAETIYSKVKGVVAAAGAEAGQEYLQTWHEILAIKVGADGTPILEALERELSKTDNQAEAAFGFAAGGVSSGLAKGITSTPGLATKLAVDTTLATGVGVSKAVQAAAILVNDHGVKKALKLLPKVESDKLLNEYKVQKVQHENLEKDRNAKLRLVTKYKSFDQVTDPEIRAKMVDMVGTGDLKDPRTFIKVRETLTSVYRSDIDDSLIALGANRVGKVLLEQGTRIAKNVASLVSITDEDIERAYRVTKIIGKKAVKQLQNFKTSSARGLIAKIIDYGSDQTKEGLNIIKEFAEESSPEILRQIADSIKDTMPAAASVLYKQADDITFSLERTGAINDRLINMDSISPSIKDTVQVGKVTDSEAVTLGLELSRDSRSRPEDLDTVKTLQKALEIYENSSLFRNGKDGVLDSDVIFGIRKKLDKFQKIYEKSTTQRAADTVKTAASHVDKFASGNLEDVGPAVRKVAKFLDSAIAAFIATKPEAQKNGTVTDGTKSYKIKKTPAGNKFMRVLQGWAKEIEEMPDKQREEGIAVFNQRLTAPNFIKGLANTFGTTDVAALTAIVNTAFPQLDAEAFTAAAAKALFGVESQATPETVTGDENQDEEGYWMAREVALQDDVDKHIKDIVGEDNVCGGK